MWHLLGNIKVSNWVFAFTCHFDHGELIPGPCEQKFAVSFGDTSFGGQTEIQYFWVATSTFIPVCFGSKPNRLETCQLEKANPHVSQQKAALPQDLTQVGGETSALRAAVEVLQTKLAAAEVSGG